MGEDHRVHQPDPACQPARELVGGRLDEEDRGEGRPQHGWVRAEADVQPVGHDRGDHQAAAQGVEGEEGRETGQWTQAPEGGCAQLGFHGWAQAEGQNGCDRSDEREDHEERLQPARSRGEARRQAAGSSSQGTRQRVAPKGQVAAPGLYRLGQDGLLEG